MTKTNRMRCGYCGMCYEGEVAAGELVAVKCETCGTTEKLLEEDPDGIMSGALPPLPRILALGVAIMFCLLATQLPIFAVISFGALVFLAVDIYQGHRKQRADRIDLWNRLRNLYGNLSDHAKRIHEGLAEASSLTAVGDRERANLSIQADLAQRSLAEVSGKYEKLRPLHEAAERDRESLAKKIGNAERNLTEISGKYEALKLLHAEDDRKRIHLAQKLAQMEQVLNASSSKYDAIDPERRDRLAAEIECQQKVLGVVGDIAQLKITKQELQNSIQELKTRIISLEEEELMQSFGFYKPMYECADSAAYKLLLNQIRDRQKAMVKDRTALRASTVFSVENDKAGGKKVVRNLEKLTLRAFNGECDATIDKVTFNNLDAIAARITKAYLDLNEVCQSIGISITQAYLNSKIEELHACYEYQVKLKEEREEQRKIREEMREQARIAKEIEDCKKKIEKEETHFNQAIAELQMRMEAASAVEKAQVAELQARMETASAAEREKMAGIQAEKESAIAAERAQYETKLREYEEQLAGVNKDKEEVMFREQSTRAGYVYIISNIGSFGDHVFKIGVTRRLEPLERIDELGDASVPFDFDVHALIFSDDAPSLEGALHEHFAERAINKMNSRKEFFRVSLDEIEEVVRTHHNKVVEFTKVAKAEDYRLTLAKLNSMAACVATTGVN